MSVCSDINTVIVTTVKAGRVFMCIILGAGGGFVNRPAGGTLIISCKFRSSPSVPDSIDKIWLVREVFVIRKATALFH